MRGDTLNSLDGLDCISHSALQHIEPPKEDLGSMSGWRGSVEHPTAIKPQNAKRQQMEEECSRGSRNDHQTWFDSCR